MRDELQELWTWWRDTCLGGAGPSCCTISLKGATTFPELRGQAHPGSGADRGAVVLLRLLVFRRSRRYRARARAHERTGPASGRAPPLRSFRQARELGDQPADTVVGQ